MFVPAIGWARECARGEGSDKAGRVSIFQTAKSSQGKAAKDCQDCRVLVLATSVGSKDGPPRSNNRPAGVRAAKKLPLVEDAHGDSKTPAKESQLT